MTRLFLCRHGETDHNREEILQGQKNTELNETGEKQAENLAGRFAGMDIDAVYSSDLERASQTAEKVARETGAPHREDERLRERSYGRFEGRPISTRYEAIEHGDELDEWEPEGGETVGEVRDRVSELLDEIESGYPEGVVVVVAHGWTNRALLTDVLGAEDGRAHSIRQDNTTVNELEKEDFRGWRVNSINDTSHLE
ncbi:MAG: histidine phosphatase family protein [Candidatus Nanohaloarchaea archaeon]